MTWVSVELRSIVGNAGSWARLTGRMPPQPAANAITAAASSVSAACEALCRMRLAPDGLGDRQHGHADAEVRAGVLAVDDLDGAAVRIHELEHDRQADARALDLHARRGPARVEGFEHARTFVGRNAGAGVGDIDHEMRVLFDGV